MVVCKCRKATKLYCFVHKVPVCGECICFPEHQICVVRTYSEWVIDGEYDWPPQCCHCKAALVEGTDQQTTRLGCLHVIHTNCLVSHVKSFPVHTTPAGYVCPACSTAIWSPNNVKDSGSRLHSKLKDAIMQTGLEKNLFGNDLASVQGAESRNPPPAFVSVAAGDREYNFGNFSSVEKDAARSTNLEIDGPTSDEPKFMSSTSPTGHGATTRKGGMQVDRQNPEVPYYADEEDTKRKYSRRGILRHKLLRSLLPFWSSALPTLPVTAPPRKDASHGDDASERRARQQRTSRIDPRKLLLTIAIMACMATMGILYYRIAQQIDQP